jgi:alkylation response protein AidB-like acyl-CoA dehydrogenase
MNFELADEQNAIRETAHQLLSVRLPSERLRALLNEGAYDEELWRELCQLGWAGLAVAEQYGGQGLGVVELSLLAEELGYSLAPVPFFASTAACLVVAHAGSETQRAEHLPLLASGDLLGSVAVLSDDLARIAVDAAEARLLLVVDGDQAWLAGPGTITVPAPSLDGTRRYATVAPELGARLPGSAATAVDCMEVLLAAELTGVAQRALDIAVAYACEREQFGRPIGTFQGVSHRCARMLLEVECSRSLAHYAAWTADHDHSALALAASAAKSSAIDAAWRVTASALQVLGGIGFTWEHDIHLLMRRARAAAQLLGSATEHRRRIGYLRRQTMVAPNS